MSVGVEFCGIVDRRRRPRRRPRSGWKSEDEEPDDRRCSERDGQRCSTMRGRGARPRRRCAPGGGGVGGSVRARLTRRAAPGARARRRSGSAGAGSGGGMRSLAAAAGSVRRAAAGLRGDRLEACVGGLPRRRRSTVGRTRRRSVGGCGRSRAAGEDVAARRSSWPGLLRRRAARRRPRPRPAAVDGGQLLAERRARARSAARRGRLRGCVSRRGVVPRRCSPRRPGAPRERRARLLDGGRPRSAPRPARLCRRSARVRDGLLDVGDVAPRVVLGDGRRERAAFARRAAGLSLATCSLTLLRRALTGRAGGVRTGSCKRARTARADSSG